VPDSSRANESTVHPRRQLLIIPGGHQQSQHQPRQRKYFQNQTRLRRRPYRKNQDYQDLPSRRWPLLSPPTQPEVCPKADGTHQNFCCVRFTHFRGGLAQEPVYSSECSPDSPLSLSLSLSFERGWTIGVSIYLITTGSLSLLALLRKCGERTSQNYIAYRLSAVLSGGYDL